MRAKIAGLGKCLPDNIVTNDDLSKMMETSDEWIRQRTGIEERRWVTNNESSTDLGLIAAEEAIKNAGIKKEDVDMILFATLSPDHFFPGNACFLQEKLGVPEIPAIDVRQQCTGFLYGLSMADNYIRSGQYKNILLVGAEIHSKGLDKTDRGRDVAVLFGDGAGAAVIQAVDVKDAKTESCIWSHHLHADGQYARELWVDGPGFGNGAEMMTHAELAEGIIYPQMNGKKVFMHAVKRMAEVIGEGLKFNQTPLDQVDFFAFHQANLRINEKVGEILGIPADKVYNTIQKYGNTTAATIPIGLYDAWKDGKLKEGDLVASAAFGSGFTWASSIFRF